ncbi:MAG: tetratricopeptide repeat protein [Bacteroidetes bacterium]|nr:tetratricopeptide repeat protein [Bacteroidota bacterium]
MHRILFTAYLTLLLGFNGYGQKRAIIDSLLLVLPQMKEDTSKVNLLKKLSFMYSEVNTDEGIKYGKQSLALAEQLAWKPGISKASNNIAMNYFIRADYKRSLEFYFKALKINEELANKNGMAINLSQIGVVYYRQQNYTKALDYYFKGNVIFEQLGDKNGIANNLGNMGLVYMDEGDSDKAVEFLLKTIAAYKELNDIESIGVYTGNLGNAYMQQKKYHAAMACFVKARHIADSIGNMKSAAYNIQNAGKIYLLQKVNLAKANRLFDTAVSIFKSLGMLYDVQEGYSSIYEVNKLSGNYKAALEAHEQYLLYKDSVFNKENTEKITRLEVTAEYEKVQLADSLKNAEAKKQAAAKLRRQRNYTYASIGGVLLLLGFSFFIIKERRKSDRLLLNILPAEVANELKQKGESDAKLFDDVTVLFTDFVGFTTVSEKLTPKQLVDELHTCFTTFDGIMAKHKIEKIKTVGDAYLAVSGLPLANEHHAENVINAAIEIRNFMLARKQELGDIGFNIRIGIHSGNVVAGIVGVKKFAYDIWGDTVNTAARMEQKSEAGKINISQTTYELVKGKFTFTYRGEIEAKNKGMMKMYFLENNIVSPVTRPHL